MAGQSGQQKKDDDVTEAEKAGREAVKETEPKDDAPQIPVERLIRESGDFLDCEPHVAAGALHGVSKKNLTVEEGKAAVKKWLSSPVKTEEA